jgi:TonB family protein
MKKQVIVAFFALFIFSYSTAQDTSPKLQLAQLKDLKKDASEQNADAKTKLQVPPVDTLPTFEMFDLQYPPSFPGGQKALQEFLANNIQYPALARQKGIQGNVVVTFVVGKDGSISDIDLVRSVGGGCDEEVFRVVRAMPDWIPGEADGKPVKVRFTLPVRFRLEEPEKPKKKKFRDRDSIFGN